MYKCKNVPIGINFQICIQINNGNGESQSIIIGFANFFVVM